MPGCQAETVQAPPPCRRGTTSRGVGRASARPTTPRKRKGAKRPGASAERASASEGISGQGPQRAGAGGGMPPWHDEHGAKRSTKLDARTMGIPLTGGGVVGLATSTTHAERHGADSPGGGDALSVLRVGCGQDRRRDPPTILPPEGGSAPLSRGRPPPAAGWVRRRMNPLAAREGSIPEAGRPRAWTASRGPGEKTMVHSGVCRSKTTPYNTG